jgi:hypothetical protein
MQLLDKLNIKEEASAKLYCARLLEVCVESRKTEYGKKLCQQVSPGVQCYDRDVLQFSSKNWRFGRKRKICREVDS